MSYIATCNGSFKLKENQLKDDLLDKVEPFFDSTDVYGSNLDVFYNGNYHEDDIEEFMNIMVDAAESGTLYCSGEDDSYWKFVLKDGEYHEYSGSIVYDEEPLLVLTNSGREEFLGQLIDQFQDAFDETNKVEDEDKEFIIQGKLYDNLKEKLLSTLKNWNVL